MKKSRCTEARILRLLQEVDAGKPVAVTAREHGVSRETILLLKDQVRRDDAYGTQAAPDS